MADWAKAILDFAVKTFIVVFAVYLAMHALFLSDLKKLQQTTAILEARAQQVDQQTQIIISMFAPNNPQILYYLAAQDEQAGNLGAAAQKLETAVRFMEANYPGFKAKLNQLNSQIKK